MPQVDQIQIGTTTYNILQSENATFTGISNDTDDSAATSWTSVERLASSETNGSIFTKISSMFKNIRYLYDKIGNIDIGDVGTSIGDAIKNLSEEKADINHTHDSSTMKASDGTPLISNTQIADNNHVPSSLLVKNMNDILTSINNERNNYVTSISLTPSSTNCSIKYFHNSTTLDTLTLGVASTSQSGLLPKLDGNSNKCLLGNGTWGNTGSTYAVFTSAANGLAPAAKSGTTSLATSAYVLTGAGWKAGTKYNTDTNTTYAAATTAANGLLTAAHFKILNDAKFGAATSAAAGTKGLVPAPGAGKQTSFLRGDGTWQIPTNTTYAVATTAANGLMTAAMVTKLNGIATGANKYVLPAATSAAIGGIKAKLDNGTLTLST